MKTYRSYSSAETKLFGNKLAKKLAKGKGKRANSRNALVFALSGDLGSGKTTFAQGFFRGLGLKKRVTSPTFILFRRFTLPVFIKTSTGRRNLPFANFYHIDAYRIKKPRELAALGFKEIISNPKNIILIEWAENIKRILPKGAVKMQFWHGRKENERTIKIK